MKLPLGLGVTLTPLTPKEIKTFEKLSKLTSAACASCPSKGFIEKKHTEFRCCDKMFCDLVEEQLSASNKTYPKPNVGGIPYMSETGCVVKPHDRPQCTGYVCIDHLKNDEFNKEYSFLCNRLAIARVRRHNAL